MKRFYHGCRGLLVLSLILISETTAQDVNNDGRFDCADADLIGMAVQNQSPDLSFDFDENGVLSHGDLFAAISRSGFKSGDANFDGEVDRLDMNQVGLNWQQSVTSYCQGDFDYNGFVDAADKGHIGINWQIGPLGIDGNMPAANVSLIAPPSRLDAWNGGFVFAEAGPFELVAIAQRAPDGLLATTVAIRTKDPNHKVVTFDDVEITGDAHQVFEPHIIAPNGSQTPFGMTFDSRRLGLDGVGRWNQADTQVLIRAEMVGGGGGGGFYGITEENDYSDPVELQPVFVGLSSLAGVGPLQSSFPTDAFYLWSEHLPNYVEFARFVTPADSSGESEGVFLKLGVQGGDADRNPLPFHGVIGRDDPLRIPFFTQPCDFNSDGFCDQQDLDQLNTAVAEGSSDPDLNLDGSDPPLITETDVAAWQNLSDPIPGDTDYDGDVDATDLNNLASNWQINANTSFGGPRITSWEGGDFNYDGHVDAADLNLLGQNWLRGVEPANATVPEPSGAVLLVIGLAMSARRFF